jgi:transcriptional regulator with XRE-family HTH domain
MTAINQGMYEFKRESLIEIRKLMGISQNKMAELLGIPPNTLSRWETGATVPDASALAAIQSLAKENSVNPPSFFAIRKSPIEFNITSKALTQPTDILTIFKSFQSYLQTHIESIGTILAPIIKVEINNSALVTSSWPQIVFTGVKLEIAHTGGDTEIIRPFKLKTKKLQKSPEPAERNVVTPWQLDSKRQKLLTIKYNNVTTIGYEQFPYVTTDESRHGEVLFPGQSLIFEMDVTPESIPYLQFKVEGTISRRHLLHYVETFSMPENITKPSALNAFIDFTKLGIYEPLENIIKVMPKFDNNTRMEELQTFLKYLVETISDIKEIQKKLDVVFHQHKYNWFKAHLRAAFIYLDRVSSNILQLKESIELNNLDKIAAAVSAILAARGESDHLNSETKELMRAYNISEEELIK